MNSSLQQEVRYLPGVGPFRAKLLAKLGIETVKDLLWAIPRDIHDLGNVRKVSQLSQDEFQTVIGIVVDCDAKETRSGKTLAAILLDCEGLDFRGVWFNQPWIIHQFRLGERVAFSGKPKKRYGQWQMSKPAVRHLGESQSSFDLQIECIYKLTEGLKLQDMQQMVRTTLQSHLGEIQDPLPEILRSRFRLPPLKDAIRQVHLPATRAEFEEGRRRLVFDDLFEWQLAIAQRRRSWRREELAPNIPLTQKVDARIRRLFPFPVHFRPKPGD